MISVYWDRIVIFLIVLSSLKLAVDTYEGISFTTTSPMGKALAQIDLVFNYAFIIEMSVKILAMGFIMDTGSYMRDAWN
jgi:hypothetical protein